MPSDRKIGWVSICVGVGVVAILGAAIALFQRTPDPGRNETPTAKDIISQAEALARKQLRAQRTATFHPGSRITQTTPLVDYIGDWRRPSHSIEDTGGTEYLVEGVLEAQNPLGVYLTDEFVASVTYRPWVDRWSLERLWIAGKLVYMDQEIVDAEGNDADEISPERQKVFAKCEAVADDALRRVLGTIKARRHPHTDEPRWRIFKNQTGLWHVYGFATPVNDRRHKFSVQMSERFVVLCVRIDGTVKAVESLGLKGDETNYFQVDGF